VFVAQALSAIAAAPARSERRNVPNEAKRTRVTTEELSLAGRSARRAKSNK
jgi:hypothetical protein